ncbi:MAG: c-type cytochrome, partial [Verrucomicrobiota bacterium]
QLKRYLTPQTKPDPPDVSALSQRNVVRSWTTNDIKNILATPHVPDAKHGRTLFRTVLCSRCHQVGLLGTPAGPNLTAVAHRLNRRDLLEAVIAPSSVIDDAFRHHVIKTRDGKETIGRVTQNNFRNSTLRVATDPFDPGRTITIPKGDITSSEPSPVSPMPPALLNTLTAEEILDLIDFLQQETRP